MEPQIYFNGAFRPEHEATISVPSRALHYGLGCFAGIRGYRTDDGRQVHVFRLSGSASEVADVIVELLRRNEVRADV